jgi:hypothetical protein
MSKRPRGALPGWKPSRPRQAGILADLEARYRQHYEEDTLPRGGRGMFYDLRPGGIGNGVTYRKPDSDHPIKATDGLPGFAPMEAHPAAVQEVLVLARRAGIIPERWVADARAPDASVPYFDKSAQEVAESIARQVAYVEESFELDPQRFQPIYIECLCEAEDLIPRLARVAGGEGVPVYSGAGFDGLKGKRAFAQRAMKRDVPTVVLHVGDYDEHGENIFRAAAEDAVAWAGGRGRVFPVEASAEQVAAWVHKELLPAEASGFLVFTRLALTAEQAEEHDLLDADGKAEVEGLPVPVMDTLLTDAIEELQDPAGREELEAEQERERERLPDAIRKQLDKLSTDEEDE